MSKVFDKNTMFLKLIWRLVFSKLPTTPIGVLDVCQSEILKIYAYNLLMETLEIFFFVRELHLAADDWNNESGFLSLSMFFTPRWEITFSLEWILDEWKGDDLMKRFAEEPRDQLVLLWQHQWSNKNFKFPPSDQLFDYFCLTLTTFGLFWKKNENIIIRQQNW